MSKMSRPNRRPIYSLAVLFCVSCAIYFVAMSDNQSLGLALKMMPEMQVSLPKAVGFGQKGDESKLATSEKSVADLSVSDLSPKEHVNPTEQNLKHENKPAGGAEQNSILLDNSEGFTETPFMPKMANETLKAKLGNSAWHLFHTVLARYPEKPSPQEKTTLKLYIHLFAQVYPCGDCARHFMGLLKKYPVQVELRKTAALWGCHVHNKVNQRLKKPEYDCTTILEDYDCGCGGDEKEKDSTLGNESAEHLRKVTLDEKEGLQHGG